MFESWFTNKCEAYVDERGIAIYGEALEQARLNPKARRCGNLVRIGARCCRFCGAPAPGHAWTCQNCGAKVSNEARFCTKCGAPQTQQDRATFIDGVWRPQDGVFAQRVELAAVRNDLDQGLDLQEGQAAILLVGGEGKDVLTPGHYTLQDIVAPAEGGDGRCSLVLLRMGRQDFPVMLEGMRTADSLEISLKCLVTLQFDHEKAVAFQTSLAGNPDFVDGDIQSCVLSFRSIAFHILMPGLEAVISQFCSQHKMEEFFLDPELRETLDEAFGNALKTRLDGVGFRFCGISGIDFSGPAYEELRRKQGDLEQRRRELQFQLMAEKLIQDHEKQSEQADMEHEQFLKQIAQKMKISDALRDQELKNIHDKIALENAINDLNRKYELAKKEQHDLAELEILEAEYQEALKALMQDGEIARRQKEHAELLRRRLEEQKAALQMAVMEAQIKVTSAKAEQTAEQLKLETEKHKNANDRANEAAQVENLNKASSATLIAMAKTPAEKEMLLELAQSEMAKNMTPEQIKAEAIRQGIPGAIQTGYAANDKDRMLKRVMGLNADNIRTDERIAAKARVTSSTQNSN